jgi:hypothetical protein
MTYQVTEQYNGAESIFQVKREDGTVVRAWRSYRMGWKDARECAEIQCREMNRLSQID